ncbi:UNVERIFIED_CONTAM: hemolysin, partial [Prevotella sp. 15_C9]
MDDFFSNLSTYVEFHLPTLGVVIAATLVLLLLLLSGFASVSEIAFFSLSPNDLDSLDAERNEND